ncbi:hypothetical protein [Nitrincola schmidtii]|uniref:hypothetical protein n=1 Tax=Nitrincola schmidtii TaxID=1730894 RepID=UPI00124E0810|nr:hypothetical protein [Nitrincola schmidtii]
MAIRTSKATQKNATLADDHALELFDQLMSDHKFKVYLHGLMKIKSSLRKSGAIKATALVKFLNAAGYKSRRGEDFSDTAFKRLRERLVKLKGIDLCDPDQLFK